MYTLLESEKVGVGRKKVVRPLVSTEDRQTFDFAVWSCTRPYHIEKKVVQDGNIVVTLEVN